MDFVEYQKELNFKWSQLEKKIEEDEDFKKAGKGKIRISEEFLFTLDTSNHSGLLIISNNIKKINKSIIPECKGWKIEIYDEQIIMSLKSKEYNDFFRDIINLILTKIYLNKLQKEESIKFFFNDLISAKNFFDSESLPKKLSPESETGLLGELYLLTEFINKKYTNEESLSYWTGPTKKHDFTTQNILLETKTSKSDGNKFINTSSNDQLSPIFEKDLYLSYVQIEKNLNGKNLSSLIEEYSKILKKESDILLNEFYIKLRQSGYYDIHKDYYKDMYILNKINFYYISKSFPYIKQIQVPEAISDLSITYKIDLDKCEEFRINEDKLLEKL
mgnify:CR=1 FL=1